MPPSGQFYFLPQMLSDEYFQTNILKPISTDYMSLAAYGLVVLLVGAFILLAFRDVFRLRTGWTRIWG
ncbi:MAG TPA: hypothetical protein VKJ65_11080, partial [Phycisphaerae bacterium]|nr:hypothetical protein [Phycisphaerae bacterium]